MDTAGIQPIPPKLGVQAAVGDRRHRGNDRSFEQQLRDRDSRPKPAPDDLSGEIDAPLAPELQLDTGVIRKDQKDGTLHVDVIA